MFESGDKRDVVIPLTHAEEISAVAERMFSSALREELEEEADATVEPYARRSGEVSHPDE
jgi:hypothetical protein